MLIPSIKKGLAFLKAFSFLFPYPVGRDLSSANCGLICPDEKKRVDAWPLPVSSLSRALMHERAVKVKIDKGCLEVVSPLEVIAKGNTIPSRADA